MRIGITGATGFVGRHLVRGLAARGFAVTAFQRPPAGEAIPGIEVHTLILPDQVHVDDFAGLDVLVHGAFVEYGPGHPDADAINREGARNVLAAARAHGARVVYLSTMSAHPGALSHYGRNKLELEALFDPSRDAILKLGLVLGDGGLFGSMAALLRDASVVPLPDGGCQPIQTLWIGDLEAAIVAIAERGLSGRFAVAHPDVRTMRELYLAICDGLGVKRTFVPVPLGLVELGAGLLETMRIPFPIRRENVLGLKALIPWDNADSMRQLGIDVPIPMEEALRRLFLARSRSTHERP